MCDMKCSVIQHQWVVYEVQLLTEFLEFKFIL
jgi:hypothetical protein